MKNNKYYSKESKQERIEKRIDIYKQAFQDIAIRNTIDQLPKNKHTLDIIEAELDRMVANLDGTQAEKWAKALKGLRYLASKVDRK